MKKKICKLVFMLIAAGLLTVVTVSQSMALPTVTFENESQLTVYGWLRNNLGIFTDKMDYTLSGNQLATCRTSIRLYTEYKATDQLNMWMALQFVHEPWYHIETGSISKRGGKEYSEYDNVNDVLRELYVNWKPAPNHNFRFGRQIVIWGEAMTTRIGDFIHPDNTRWTFAFANLEDTRIPNWMVRGTHYSEQLLNGTELEWLFIPNFESKEWRVGRGGAFATWAPPFVTQPGQRFGIYPETRTYPEVGRNITVFQRDAAAGGFSIPAVSTEYPRQSLSDSRIGARLTSYLWGASISLAWFHTQTYTPVVKFGQLVGINRNYILVYPKIDIYGASMNKQLPLGVMRAEATWTPYQPYGTFDVTDADGIVKKALIKYMLAWDVKFYTQWHKTASFDLTLEHTADVVPNADRDTQFAIYAVRQNTYDPAINVRLATDWVWARYHTEVIFGYIPKIKGGLFMPIVSWNPLFMNHAWKFEARYIRVFADTNRYGIGILQQKDMAVLTTQFNF